MGVKGAWFWLGSTVAGLVAWDLCYKLQDYIPSSLQSPGRSRSSVLQAGIAFEDGLELGNRGRIKTLRSFLPRQVSSLNTVVKFD